MMSTTWCRMTSVASLSKTLSSCSSSLLLPPHLAAPGRLRPTGPEIPTELHTCLAQWRRKTPRQPSSSPWRDPWACQKLNGVCPWWWGQTCWLSCCCVWTEPLPEALRVPSPFFQTWSWVGTIWSNKSKEAVNIHAKQTLEAAWVRTKSAKPTNKFHYSFILSVISTCYTTKLEGFHPKSLTTNSFTGFRCAQVLQNITNMNSSISSCLLNP